MEASLYIERTKLQAELLPLQYSLSDCHGRPMRRKLKTNLKANEVCPLLFNIYSWNKKN